MSISEDDPPKPGKIPTPAERVEKLKTALDMLEQALTILDDMQAFSVSGRVSMAVDLAKYELAALQFRADSSAA